MDHFIFIMDHSTLWVCTLWVCTGWWRFPNIFKSEFFAAKGASPDVIWIIMVIVKELLGTRPAHRISKAIFAGRANNRKTRINYRPDGIVAAANQTQSFFLLLLFLFLSTSSWIMAAGSRELPAGHVHTLQSGFAITGHNFSKIVYFFDNVVILAKRCGHHVLRQLLFCHVFDRRL